jgi:hypothetical protein
MRNEEDVLDSKSDVDCPPSLQKSCRGKPSLPCVFKKGKTAGLETPPSSARLDGRRLPQFADLHLARAAKSVLQKKIIPILHYALKSSGFLVLGSPKASPLFLNCSQRRIRSTRFTPRKLSHRACTTILRRAITLSRARTGPHPTR